ncbi:MAG TPA: NAD(P)H-dependent oxidoreductase [Acetobacteraceae bacterium]|nr:NAD(P)H-dependent oxidoreductase [Acetobacteraceae bacterium]
MDGSSCTAPPMRLLGLPGSLRRGSHSRAILRGLVAELVGRIQLEIREIDLPLYNQDEDGDAAPHSIREFRRAIAESDGLVIATPEYNHGMPGVLKNALDWASRPYGKSALTDKPVLVISNSPGFVGGARAHVQVNETLHSIPARLLGGQQVVIPNVAGKIRDDRLADAASLRFALAAVDRLATLCRARSPSGAT